ncbi:MAG: rhomboid family intramembrane serine protease [Flavobacteriales bacterium]|nr:rhomboid family intramembrane serine protease [Flavobacteriales bacterium]
MFNQITPVVKNLIIINALFFGFSWVMPDLFYGNFAGFYIFSEYFRPWQIVTHMFMHGYKNLLHIFFNMYALYLFGSALERAWGARRFLTYYMVCGLGAFFLHEFVFYLEWQSLLDASPAEDVSKFLSQSYVVGASGAVFGILLGFGLLFPNAELMLLFPPIPIKAKWFVIIYGAIEIMMAIQNSPTDQVAHYAHLGGMLFGYILLKIWQRKSNSF